MRRALVRNLVVVGLLSSGLAGAAPTSFVHAASGVLASSLTPAALDEAAQVALRAYTAAELRPARQTRLRRGERVVRLRQQHQGLPVLMRGAAVVFGADGVARQVGGRLEEELPASVMPTLREDEARARAAQSARWPLPELRLAIWPGAAGGQLVYVASGRPSAALPTSPVVVIDAHSGDVIVRYDAATSVNQAKVYPTNPIKSPTLEPVTLAVAAGEKKLTNEFITARNCIDEHVAKDLNIGSFAIKAHVCTLKSTAEPDATSGDYLIDPPAEDTAPEDAFAELSIFHHTNRILARFREFSPDFVPDGGTIEAVANLRIPQGFDSFDLGKIGDPDLPLVPFQNAFFAPSDPLFSQIFGIKSGAMWFGQGPKRDYSYDGDVVYHEFGHAMINATIQLVSTPHLDEYGVSVSNGAMNEGLADYFSSALAGDPDVGEYATTDFAPGSKAIRSLTDADTCPGAIAGEVHQDATLFSSALWEIRAGLAEDKRLAFDEAIFAALVSAPSGDLGYEDLAQQFVASTKTAFDQTTADALTAAFTQRGVLPGCTRILEHTGTPLVGPKALFGAWLALGTQTTGVKNFSPGVVQFHAKVAAGTQALEVTFKSVQLGGGGGGNPFGGGGTPFAPVVAVRFGEPVMFQVKPFKALDGVTTQPAKGTGTSYTTTIEVPADATDVYVMIGSSGQSDGAYTSFDLQPTEPTGAGGAGGAGGASPGGAAGAVAGGAGGEPGGAAGVGGASSEGGAGSGGSPAGGQAGQGGTIGTPAASPAASDEDSGCGCRVARPASPLGGLAVAALAVALASRRRRGR